MNVLHLIDSLNYGGAEKLLTDYIPSLKEYKHTIVTFSGPNVYGVEGYQYFELNMQPPGDFLKILAVLRKLVRRKNIKIIHSHSYWTNIISRFIGGKDARVFNHYHFADYDHAKNNKHQLLKMLDALTTTRSLTRIAVSGYVKKILENTFPKSRIELLPNFIRCVQIHRKVFNNADPVKVVAVGNFSDEKNYKTAINCFKKLEDLPLELHIFGGGPQTETYRRYVESIGCKNIIIYGYTSNIPDKMQICDIFLSTSSRETFGLVVLEAMCAGLPLILSDIPAFREIAPDQTRFFNNHDSEDLRQKLLALVNDLPNLSLDYDSYKKKLSLYSRDSFLNKLRELYAGNNLRLNSFR